MLVLNCEVGVLLQPLQPEEKFNQYNIYDGKYGYYDENQIVYKQSDLDKAIEYAKAYVKKGVEKTYAIITNQGDCGWITEENFDDGEFEGFTYDMADIIFSIAKINEVLVEHFINT